MGKSVYVDNSVIGGYFDPEFDKYSQALFREFRLGLYVPVLSTLTEAEINNAPTRVKEKYLELKEIAEFIEPSEEAFKLADRYLIEGGLTKRMRTDCLHIATATVHGISLLTSWNFRDIVNVNKIAVFHSVNIKLGYLLVEIRSPRELLHEENI
jgi:predicted nucleic acid-binding protein